MTSGEYIVSPEQIMEGVYYALPYEVTLMNEQLGELKGKQHDIAGHITEAMEQSSETWHDNAPADALFSELRILDQQEAKFKKARRKLEIVEYPRPDYRLVTIGSRALCSIVGEAFQIDVTGNLPIRMEPDDDTEIGSIAAPLPRAILGSKPGDSVEADVNGRLVTIQIIDLDQTAQRTFYEKSPDNR